MTFGTPSRTEHVHNQILQWILSGELAQGAKLPSHLDLAARFEVAPMTVRTALTRLEQEGYVSREHGRGTFVRGNGHSTVLLVEDDPASLALLRAQVMHFGSPSREAASAPEALAMLANDTSIALIVTDVHMPDKECGLTFIREAHERWPDIPLAAVTGYPDDLAGLYGTPACPFLVLSKPVEGERLDALLSVVLARTSVKSGPHSIRVTMSSSSSATHPQHER